MLALHRVFGSKSMQCTGSYPPTSRMPKCQLTFANGLSHLKCRMCSAITWLSHDCCSLLWYVRTHIRFRAGTRLRMRTAVRPSVTHPDTYIRIRMGNDTIANNYYWYNSFEHLLVSYHLISSVLAHIRYDYRVVLYRPAKQPKDHGVAGRVH